MRVLVFAHTPPPHHGQSYMIRLMLENLGHEPGDNLSLFHVNARLSDDMEDIGSWRWTKLFRLFGYILQAWWLRWHHRIDVFYYVPAPAKRSALYRDWLVLSLAAPVFKKRIFHWHATGLGPWIEEGEFSGGRRGLEARVTWRLLKRHDLSCVLNEWGRNDIAVFSPPRVAVVANGIPDPCPDFDAGLMSERIGRLQKRRLATAASPALFRLLYLAHATREKGLFDTLDALALANARLKRDEASLRFCLTVAGAFISPEEEVLFQARIRQPDLSWEGAVPAVTYAGFVGALEKDRLLREADALCFASYFPNEGQPVAVIEALAYGLPVVLTRWRALPEMISPDLAFLINPQDPQGLSDLLPQLAQEERFQGYRAAYAAHYSLAAHCRHLRQALLAVNSPS